MWVPWYCYLEDMRRENLQLCDNPNVTSLCVKIGQSSFFRFAMIICWPGRDSSSSKCLLSSKHFFELTRWVFEEIWVVLPGTTIIPQCSFPRHQGFRHSIYPAVPRSAPPSMVTAGTWISPVLAILCNTFCSFFSGLIDDPIHKRFIIFHKR